MERSLKIHQLSRFNGITYVVVDGKVEEKDAGRKVTITDVFDQTANVTEAVILAVVPPSTLRIEQKGHLNIPGALTGGTVTFIEGQEAPPAVAAKPPVTPPVVPTPPAKPTPPPVRIPMARGVPLKK